MISTFYILHMRVNITNPFRGYPFVLDAFLLVCYVPILGYCTSDVEVCSRSFLVFVLFRSYFGFCCNCPAVQVLSPRQYANCLLDTAV